MNKRILITGGAGFIGSAFTRKIFEQQDLDLLVIDKMTYSSNINSLPGDPSKYLRQVDISSSEDLEREILDFNPDFVVHFAAETHVDRSIDGPSEFINTNILGTFNLLHSCLKLYQQKDGAEKEQFRFVHISTDEVFGSSSGKPFEENDPYFPSSPYSASKASADHLVRAWNTTYNFPALIVNTCNNYGPFQNQEKLIPKTILCLMNGHKIPVYGEGLNIRDWIHVEDHADAIFLVIKNGVVGSSYNIGVNNQIKNIDIVNSLCDLACAMDLQLPSNLKHHRELIVFVNDRPGHDFCYSLSSQKIERELGWKPKYQISDGLELTLKWYIDNFDKIDSYGYEPNWIK